MSRLIAFGCSNTYGQGLEDCYVNGSHGDSPSKLSWPFLLGELLEKEVVNNGYPSVSNFEILYRILNFDFQKNDVVVILWTFYFRDLIFKDAKNYERIGTWNKSKIFNDWAMTHSNIDLKIRSLFHMNHAELYLNSLDIKNFSFVIDPELVQDIPEYLNIKNLKLNVNLIQVDNALDEYHLGPISHKRYALSFYKEMQ
jgi:hypothetical protein